MNDFVLYSSLYIDIFRHLWEMFHILGMNAALGMIGGQAALIFSEMDFVRKDVHSCSAVGGAINFFYIGCSALLFTKAHAIFKAFTEGVIGGRTKTYLCIGWGLPFVGKCDFYVLHSQSSFLTFEATYIL